MKLTIDKTNWTPVSFGDVVAERRKNTKDPVADGLQHIVGLEHIDAESIHLRRSEPISADTTFSKTFRKGDVLFGRRRAYLKKAAQAPFSGICSGDITVMYPKDGLIPELLPFLINNDKFFDYAVEHSAGGLSPRVKFRDLANYQFLLPPKPEQARLAELLWAGDGVLEGLERVTDCSNVQKRALVKGIFEKSRCDKTRLKNLSTNLDSRRIPIKSSNRNSGQYPYYGATGIVDYVEGYIYDEKILLISEDGENLNTRKYPIAYSVDEKCWVNNHSHVLSFNDDRVRQLVRLFFNQADISKFLNSGTRPKINKGVLMEVPLLLPRVEYLTSDVNRINKIEFAIRQVEGSILSTRTLQKSLINQIF